MKVLISGRHIEVTPAIRDFIEKKAVKIEEFFPGVREVKVVLDVQKYRHNAEIVFKAAGQTITARKTTKDMYASIEEVLHAVERQATKRKEKLYSERARRTRGRGAPSMVMEEPAALAVEKAARRKAQAPKLPRISTVKVKAGPMTVEEAALAMLKTKAEVFPFIRAETKSVCVLIRRKRDLGLIES